MACPRMARSSCPNGSASPLATRSCSLHEIEPQDRLRHRMLHLETRVHLHEVEIAGFRDELDRSRADVVDGAGGTDGGFAHPGPQFGINRRRWRFLHHLLMPPLHRAVPLEEV